MKKGVVLLLGFLFLGIFLLNSIYALTDTDGNGYLEIHNCVELQSIENNLNANYELVNDVDCSATRTWKYFPYEWDKTIFRIGFRPLGEDSPFLGDFNGRGHIISNLFMDGYEGWYSVGLFRDVGGNISNLGLTNIYIADADHAGALVSFNTGKISCSYSTGKINSSGYSGGLVGVNYDSSYNYAELITNSYSSVNLIGSGTKGGLVGYNYNSKISNSYSTGNISSIESYSSAIGGLVGRDVAGRIFNSYSKNNLYFNSNSENNSYDMDGAGGLVGYTASTNKIFNSYSTGFINTYSAYAGGLIGISSQAYGENLFWDIDTSGQNIMCGWNGGCEGGIGKTTSEMKNPQTFIDAGWNTSIWNLRQGYYPELYMRECNSIKVDYNLTEGEDSSHATIVCSVELKNMLQDNLQANFSIYSMNSGNESLVASSKLISLESVEEDDQTYSFTGQQIFENVLNETSPVLKCKVEFIGAINNHNLKGTYNSDPIKDIDGDGYMSFWQAKSMSQCPNFNVDVEGEDDWPYDDSQTTMSKNCPIDQANLNCSILDVNGLSVYNLCAHCRNVIPTCSQMEDQKYISKCNSENTTGYWLRGVGWFPNAQKIDWKMAHRYPNYLSDLSCTYFAQVDGTEIGKNGNSNLDGKEYLTYDGFVKVIADIENEYYQDNGIYPDARMLSRAIFFTYYESDIRTNPIFVTAWPAVFSSKDLLESFEDKYILRHPEFYSSDIKANVFLDKNGKNQYLPNSYSASSDYGSPLGRSQECLIKKVYLNGKLISMSHLMMMANSLEARTNVFLQNSVLWIRGGYGNMNNLNGDISAIPLQLSLYSPLKLNSRLSDILSAFKGNLDTTTTALSLASSIPSKKDISKFCTLVKSSGGKLISSLCP